MNMNLLLGFARSKQQYISVNKIYTDLILLREYDENQARMPKYYKLLCHSSSVSKCVFDMFTLSLYTYNTIMIPFVFASYVQI